MDGTLLQLAQQLVNGISLGSIYALIALGYTMVYGIMKLINFAHGDIYMVGAYVGFFAATTSHLPFIPSIILAMAATGIIGVVIEKLAYKPLRHSPKIAILTNGYWRKFIFRIYDHVIFNAATTDVSTFITKYSISY